MRLPTHIASAPFTADQALAAGVSKRQLAALVSSGHVVRMLRTVYLAADLINSLPARVDAVATVLPEFGIVCDRTAAWIHGVETLEYHELDLPPRLDVVVLRDFTRRRRAEVTPRVRDLQPRDVMRIGPVRVTTPLRTALDLGCQLHRRAAMAALDQFAGRHGVTPQDLEAELPRFRGRRGVIQCRELANLVEPHAESPAESRVRITMMDAGLPRPVVQHPVFVAGLETFRLDLAYPKHRICIEYDGEEFHSGIEDVEHDARRREWLRVNGWIVIVVTKDDWDGDSIDRWTSQIAGALLLRQRPRSVRRFALPRR